LITVAHHLLKSPALRTMKQNLSETTLSSDAIHTSCFYFTYCNSVLLAYADDNTPQPGMPPLATNDERSFLDDNPSGNVEDMWCDRQAQQPSGTILRRPLRRCC
jgi:hypothetical protein